MRHELSPPSWRLLSKPETVDVTVASPSLTVTDTVRFPSCQCVTWPIPLGSVRWPPMDCSSVIVPSQPLQAAPPFLTHVRTARMNSVLVMGGGCAYCRVTAPP